MTSADSKKAYARAWRAANIEKSRGYTRAYTSANREKKAAAQRRYRAECPEAVLASKRAYREANREKLREAGRIYRAVYRGRVARSKRVWQAANPSKLLAEVNKRRASKLKAVPIWADHAAITRVYATARSRGLHVDHIVPLQSRLVCGLHTHENLCTISEVENRSKGNRFWPDMP